MAGHSKWHQIRYKKSVTDQKRGLAFSKLINAVVVAARFGPDPLFNPRLRTMIERARAANVPQENIERAIGRSQDPGETPDEMIMEAYGPSGVAIIIQITTSNKNRTIQEIKNTLREKNIKLAEPGSVRWSFNEPCEYNKFIWTPSFLKEVGDDEKNITRGAIEVIKNHPDVDEIFTNIKW